ncbi:MAG: hypothetical protein ACOC0P_04510, partial [Planctomycetota bacterium]
TPRVMVMPGTPVGGAMTAGGSGGDAAGNAQPQTAALIGTLLDAMIARDEVPTGNASAGPRRAALPEASSENGETSNNRSTGSSARSGSGSGSGNTSP